MFDKEKVTNEIIEFIRNYYKENNLKGAVIGISGGKDSGVVAGLFSKAIGPENIIGVTMPCESKAQDREDAKLVAEKFGFELVNVDLTDTYHTYKNEIYKICDDEEKMVDANINLKPKFRMSTLYFLAAMYSKIKGGTYIVPGTGNKSELFVGYFTKGGDSVSDISVLGDLTVSEVIKVGEVVGVPEEVLYKKPSDGLSEKSDEDKLGVTYDAIEKYINGIKQDEEIEEKIKKLHNNTRHKFNLPTYRQK